MRTATSTSLVSGSTVAGWSGRLLSLLALVKDLFRLLQLSIHLLNLLLQQLRLSHEREQQLREELADAKSAAPRPRPTPKASELERDTALGCESSEPVRVRRRGKPMGPRLDKIEIHRKVKVELPNPPEGAKILRYESFVVQELEIHTINTQYERARYELPDGTTVLAPLPQGVVPVDGGHFGVELVVFILNQYHQAQVTEPLLLQQLWDYKVVISAGQLHKILTEHLDVFHQEKEEVLQAGLTTASYIEVDDTSAPHRGGSGHCTSIGNQWFTVFTSTDHKSRVDFLEAMQGVNRIYVINEATKGYWEKRPDGEKLVQVLMSDSPQEFHSEAEWKAHLTACGIKNKEKVRQATEGALLGGLIARGVSPTLVIVSDGSDRFRIMEHASCWVHAERMFAEWVPKNEAERQAIEDIRNQIWIFYHKLGAYKEQPTAALKQPLREEFDKIMSRNTGHTNVDRVLSWFREHKEDLLRVLDRPEVPLHTNMTEGDIREFVKRKKISGDTHNDKGRGGRDTFASLRKTCRKLGVNPLEHLRDRIKGIGAIPRLADLIRAKAAESKSKDPPIKNPAAVPA